MGANPNARDVRGEPALIAAIHGEKFDAAQALIGAKGIDLDAENSHGQTALMVAAFAGRIELVNALLDAGAEIHHEGWTALHYAALGGHVDVVNTLLEHGAYIDAESPSHTTPLMLAARIKDRESCQLLADQGADPTPRNDAGLDAADFARKAGDAELAAWFERRVGVWHASHPAPAAPTS
jgi:ankyrin repeat protein